MSQGKELQTVISVGGVMSPSLRKAVADVNKQLASIDKEALAAAQTIGTKISDAAKTAAKAIAGIGLAAGAAFGGALVKGGNDYIRTMNDMAAQTGATGKELEEFGQIAQDIYKSGKGENFQEIADSLVNIRQASGLAGEELKAAADASMLLKDTFGMESAETTQAATALMKNFGLSAEQAYGLIAKGAQGGANKNGDMLDVLNEYSVHYKALGLTADQFMQSLIAGAEAGAPKIDFIGDAVKEFTIRSKDASDTTADAFKAIGLNADNMGKQLAQGGQVGQAAFFQTVEALQAIKDPVKQNELAIALFGTKFEDLEKGVLPVLGSMKDASFDAVQTLKDIEKIKYEDAGYALSKVGRSIEVGLIPAAEAVGLALFDAMPQIESSVAAVMPTLQSLGQSFAAAIPGIIDGVGELAGIGSSIVENWGLIGPVVYTVAGAFAAVKIGGVVKDAYTAVKAVTLLSTAYGRLALAKGKDMLVTAQIGLLYAKDAIAKGLSTAATWASTAASTAATVATTALGGAIAFLTSPIGIAVAAIAGLIAAGVWMYKNWDVVKEKAAQLGAFIGAVWTNIKTGVSNAVTAIGNFVGGIWTKIKDGASALGESIKSALSNAFNSLMDIVKTPINWIIGKINGLIEKINGIGSINIPGIGNVGVNIPTIPMLAAGGFTNGVSIAGERGQEAVISFDPQYRKQNIGYLNEAADRLGVSNDLGYYAEKTRAITANALSGGGLATTYNLGGITFAPTVTISGGSVSRESVIEQLRSYQGELLDLIEELLESREAGNYGAAGVF